MKELLRKIIKNVLKIFFLFSVDSKKVYLTSFSGTAYGFDSKAFAEYLIENYPGEYKLYWEVKSKDEFVGKRDGITLVKKKSISALFHSMTSGILIFNFVPRSYVPYRKEQVIINTWHGNPVKKVGRYAIHYNPGPYSLASCFTSHSKEYTDKVLRDSFEYKGEVLNCGVPRNDIFFSDKRDETANKIKEHLGIGKQKIVLYAPTFRGDFNQENSGLDVISLKNTLEKKFSGEWLVLYRLHPMVANNNHNFKEYEKDVSKYPDMQDLLLISDVLITDYSSSMWDFSQQKKPVFIFAEDLLAYEGDRGLYRGMDTLPYPLCQNNEELQKNIMEFDNNMYQVKLEGYFEETGCFENGNACESILRYAENRNSR